MTPRTPAAAALRAIADYIESGAGSAIAGLQCVDSVSGLTPDERRRVWGRLSDAGPIAAARLLQGVAARIEGEGEDEA